MAGPDFEDIDIAAVLAAAAEAIHLADGEEARKTSHVPLFQRPWQDPPLQAFASCADRMPASKAPNG
jgi:hypothetical protein